MFDDQPLSTGGQPPTNLPFGEPEDILASADRDLPEVSAPSIDLQSPPSESVAVSYVQPKPVASTQPLVRTASTALGAGILKPKHAVENQLTPNTTVTAEYHMGAEPLHPPSNNAIPSSQTEKGPPDLEPLSPMNSGPDIGPQQMYAIKAPSTSKSLMGILIFVVLFLLFGVGIYFVYANFIRQDVVVIDSNSDSFVDDSTQVVDDNVPEDSILDNGTDVTSGILDDQILFGEPIDRDGDGLDDDREVLVGTDPKNWDSDGDELSDGDEVTIWKTDPLNPDTDGDTYLDGAEIKSGYSPTGPGKLFELPNLGEVNQVEITNTSTVTSVSTTTTLVPIVPTTTL